MLGDWKESEFYWKRDTELGALAPVSSVLNSGHNKKIDALKSQIISALKLMECNLEYFLHGEFRHCRLSFMYCKCFKTQWRVV